MSESPLIRQTIYLMMIRTKCSFGRIIRSKVQNFTVFSVVYMIRILIQNQFRAT